MAFVTLTYTNDFLPRNEFGRQSLRKRDIQLFIKRVRKKHSSLTDEKFKYYCVGEYGSHTFRPHYHIMFFNLHRICLDNLQDYWSKEGHPIGIVHSRPVNGARIHYITKYHVNYDPQKTKGFGVEKEFAIMSKGLGKGYVERTGSWNLNSGKKYVMNGGFKQAMPRYIREKLWPDDSKIWKEIQTASVIKDSDTKYAEEVERLMKEGYKFPTEEIDHRNITESDKIQQEPKRKDQI